MIAAKSIICETRPPFPPGRTDKYLPDIAQDLRRLLEKTQHGFTDRSVVWPGETVSELAATLVGFGEDVHVDVGLWRSLENYHREFFGAPLPLATGLDPAPPLTTFDARRLQHLLWTLWAELSPAERVSPTHPNLLRLAEVAGAFLEARFAPLPKDSSVKNFLASPSQFGWEIKRKLIWLGTHSYLFRWFYADYVSQLKAAVTIGDTDDFICQESTAWAGLGAIDILAGVLDVSAEDRASLRTWYERHAAFYRVLSRQDRGGQTETILLRNLVNRQPYTVRMDTPQCPFHPGQVIFGSLTPWRGEWYWSGEQRTYQSMTETDETNVRKEMLERSSGIAYRYCPAEAAQAREYARQHHTDYVARCGGDLVVYPDGLALAAAEQKHMESLWRATDHDKVRRVMQERGLTQPRPSLQFPREFLDHDQGIGAFSSPEEGQEFMLGFNHILSGLRKRGEDLSTTERSALRHFVTGQVISPAFVRRLVREHGAASLRETFCLHDLSLEPALTFLLRTYKGCHFRNRYPSLALVQND